MSELVPKFVVLMSVPKGKFVFFGPEKNDRLCFYAFTSRQKIDAWIKSVPTGVKAGFRGIELIKDISLFTYVDYLNATISLAADGSFSESRKRICVRVDQIHPHEWKKSKADFDSLDSFFDAHPSVDMRIPRYTSIGKGATGRPTPLITLCNSGKINSDKVPALAVFTTLRNMKNYYPVKSDDQLIDLLDDGSIKQVWEKASSWFNEMVTDLNRVNGWSLGISEAMLKWMPVTINPSNINLTYKPHYLSVSEFLAAHPIFQEVPEAIRQKVIFYKGYSIHLGWNEYGAFFICGICKGEHEKLDKSKFKHQINDQKSMKAAVEKCKLWIDEQAKIDEREVRRAARAKERQQKQVATNSTKRKWFIPMRVDPKRDPNSYIEYNKNKHGPLLAHLLIQEDLFQHLGCRRWFIDAGVLKFLMSAKTPDRSFKDIFFPYDSLELILEDTADEEATIRFKGNRITHLKITRLRSEIARKRLNVLARAKYAWCEYYSSEQCVITICAEDPKESEARYIALVQIDTDTNKMTCTEMTCDPKFIDKVSKLVLDLLLLYSARVELFKDYAIPRSQRYELNRRLSDKHNTQTITLMPLKKMIIQPAEHLDNLAGQKRRTHLRGWVLRTLRHPKFKRRPDGNCRVIEVRPCIINDPNKEDEDNGNQ